MSTYFWTNPNVQEMSKDRLAKVPKDFPLEIFTVDGKRAYEGGENIAFRVRSTQEAHIVLRVTIIT